MNWHKRFTNSLPSYFTLTQIQDAAIRIGQRGGPIERRKLIERLENLLQGTSLTPRHFRVWPGIPGMGEE